MNKSIIYLCMLFAMVFISCGDKWDEYYNGNDGSKEEELDQTLQEFLQNTVSIMHFTKNWSCAVLMKN